MSNIYYFVHVHASNKTTVLYKKIIVIVGGEMKKISYRKKYEWIGLGLQLVLVAIGLIYYFFIYR